MEELRNEYSFERIADVDMALWTLAQIVNSSRLQYHSIYGDFHEAHKNTSNPVKKIRARNSLEQIKGERLLFKADLFLESDCELAGLIAGRELERFAKSQCLKYEIKLGTRTPRGERRSFYTPRLLDQLALDKRITKEECEDAKEWWHLRCDLTHKMKFPFTENDIKAMVDGIRNLILKYE